MQSLLKLLNFACRAFCRRLINATIGIEKQHYKTQGNKHYQARSPSLDNFPQTLQWYVSYKPPIYESNYSQ